MLKLLLIFSTIQYAVLHPTLPNDFFFNFQAAERDNKDCPICLTSLCNTSENTPRELTSPCKGDHKEKIMHQKSASAHKISEQTKFGLPQLVPPQGGKNRNAESKTIEQQMKKSVKCRKTVLLSCTHVFHETCLLTLEELALGDIRNKCPVCRAVYQKRIISL